MSDVLTAAGINAAAQTANNLFNIASVNRMNKKTRKWNEQMYERQKADNIAFWRMQNEYNDPSAQMARLKAAGLNPNLVYGSSSPANTADSISSPNKPQWHPDAPRLDLNATDVLHQIYAIPNLQAQTENLKENNSLLRANALKVAAETANLGIKNAQDQLSYEMAKSLFNTTIEQAKMNLRKTETDILTAIDANDRANALHAPTVEKALLEIVRAQLGVSLDRKTLQALEQDIQKKISENRILKKQAQMWENNQNPNDPTWIRWAVEAIRLMWNDLFGEKEKPKFSPQGDDRYDPQKWNDAYIESQQWKLDDPYENLKRVSERIRAKKGLPPRK